jgi:hypothetical protein
VALAIFACQSLTPSIQAADAPTLLLTNGFAHNDYEHRRPLLDALELGFCAVEADIYLTNKQILVAHDWDKLSPQRTLESLYLEPLAQRVRANKGKVYKDGPEFLLLIDIKTEADSTYAALKQVLARYRPILSTFSDQSISTNAISVILSGNRPIEAVQKESKRLAAIDGRIPDLQAHAGLSLMPLISDNWSKLFRWQGHGAIPEAEKARLQKMVTQAHQQKRKLRLWAAPDTPAAWRLQKDLGIDLINTDKLVEFAAEEARMAK